MQHQKQNLLRGEAMKTTHQILSQQKKESETVIALGYQNKTHELIIPFTDEASIQNIITCTATLLHFKIHIEVINERLQTLEPS